MRCIICVCCVQTYFMLFWTKCPVNVKEFPRWWRCEHKAADSRPAGQPPRYCGSTIMGCCLLFCHFASAVTNYGLLSAITNYWAIFNVCSKHKVPSIISLSEQTRHLIVILESGRSLTLSDLCNIIYTVSYVSSFMWHPCRSEWLYNKTCLENLLVTFMFISAVDIQNTTVREWFHSLYHII